MEMEMEVQDDLALAAAGVPQSLLDRLSAAAAQLEQAASRVSSRESELEQLLAQAEATIASLRTGRRTLPAGVSTLVAKDGMQEGHALQASALDAALGSLSLEQRIAVKAQLLRAGLIG